MQERLIEVYTDGSNIHNQRVSWAFVATQNNKLIYSDSGEIDGPAKAMRNVAGELEAVIKAVKYCRENNYTCVIYADYQGCSKWVADFFGGFAWRTNNKFTRDYRKFIFDNKQHIEDISWIPGHNGDEWNEKADELAKKVLGLKKKV